MFNILIMFIGSEDDIHMQSDEIDGEISIGTEIPDQEPIDEIDSREIPENVQEDPPSSSINLHIDDSHGKIYFFILLTTFLH